MKFRYIVAFAILLIAVLPNLVGAQTSPIDPCGSMFLNTQGSIGGTFAALRSISTYTGLISYTLLIIMAMLMILSMLYVIGISFKIDKLIVFSRTEALESLLNFAIIIFVAGGMLGIDSVVVAITQMGSAVTASGVAAPTIKGVFYNSCDYYYSDAIGQVGNIFDFAMESYMLATISTITTNLMPNGFGISFMPLKGIFPASQATNSFGLVVVGITGIELSNAFLLVIIYYLFPLFLFLGVILRSFPWTRAIGGALLGLFIAFYVFYPTLLYAFASVANSISGSASTAISAQEAAFKAGEFTNSLKSLESGNVGSIFTDFLTGIIGAYGEAIAISVVNVIGIVISLIISFDMIEAFGDLLGAPSLTGSNVLKKVI
jgi:hypothetical protein